MSGASVDPKPAPSEPQSQEKAAARNQAGREFSGPAWLWRRGRSKWVAIGLAIAGPILAIATYVWLSQANSQTVSSIWFRALILADLCYLVAVAALIGLRGARLLAARRAGSAGAQLHTRMVGVFTGVAAAPAILVAIFFFLAIQLGLEAWFSDRVASVVQNSREVAQAYAREHRETVRSRAAALANELNLALRSSLGGFSEPRFRQALDRATAAAGFSDVYIIDSSGDILMQGRDSFLFSYIPPTPEDITQSQDSGIVVREDSDASEMRALIPLDAMFDAFLYVARPVNGDVLARLSETNRVVAMYDRLEENRDVWLFQFAVLYLGFVLIVLLASVYLGFWFADSIARPIGRLAEAAQRVRSGDLVARVKEEKGDDEIALLSRAFNRMTKEVKRKQDDLTEAHEETERRRLFSEAVLSGVSAGVLGLDAEGRLRLLNRSAAKLLGVTRRDVGKPFSEVAPEFAEMLSEAAAEPGAGVERPIRITRGDQDRELLARVTTERMTHAAEEDGPAARARRRASEGEIVGFVLTLDDMTALLSAQRMAAWGDVARRIAHEIKNPLTPIQLAAERLRRKYSDQLGDDADALNRYTETIVRQTGDIRRMVDAFVRFAKMPAPVMAVDDLAAVTREAFGLQEEARAHISYKLEFEPGAEALPARCDRGQISQAVTNILQNAADSIHGRLQRDKEEGVEGAAAEIRVKVRRDDEHCALIEVSDNGIGLPAQDRRKLLEPYVTTREKGAGLGLAIVLKIIEEHHGGFELTDAEPFAEGARLGAMARMRLPLLADLESADAGGGAAAPRQKLTEPV